MLRGALRKQKQVNNTTINKNGKLNDGILKIKNKKIQLKDNRETKQMRL